MVSINVKVVASDERVDVSSENISVTIAKMIVIPSDVVAVAVSDNVTISSDTVTVACHYVSCHGSCEHEEESKCYKKFVH